MHRPTLRRCRLGVFLLGLLLLAPLACGNPTPPPPRLEPDEVGVAPPVVEESLVLYDEYPGKIDAQYTVEIRPQVSGKLLKVNFEDGDLVKQGQVLFEIDPREYAAALGIAKAKVANAKAQEDFADAEAKRAAVQFAKNAISKEEYESKLRDYDVKKSEVRQAQEDQDKQQLSVDWTKVTSPIAGRASRRAVDAGNLVNGSAGGATLLTTVVSTDPVYVYFDVDERAVQARHANVIAKGQESPVERVSRILRLKIPVRVGLTNERGYPHEGVIDFVDNRVNASTGTVRVRGLVANPRYDLRPGYFARVQVPAGEPRRAVLVSERVIGTQQNMRYVLVVDGQNKVQAREVRLGRVHDGLRVIESGLTGDEKVIVDDIQTVRPGETVRTKPAAMPRPKT